ncbi:unnamed protein product [Trichobilharzia regenti]|nr:unnamed protein product [Trichobilharzia regenti]
MQVLFSFICAKSEPSISFLFMHRIGYLYILISNALWIFIYTVARKLPSLACGIFPSSPSFCFSRKVSNALINTGFLSIFFTEENLWADFKKLEANNLELDDFEPFTVSFPESDDDSKSFVTCCSDITGNTDYATPFASNFQSFDNSDLKSCKSDYLHFTFIWS